MAYFIKQLLKFIRVLLICSPWLIAFARSFTVLINCVSQERCFLKPCFRFVRMLLLSKFFKILLCNIYSKTLNEMVVKLGDIRASVHVSGIPLWVREALNNSVIASAILSEVSLSIIAGIPSGPFALYTFKSSRSFFTPSVVIIVSFISDRAEIWFLVFPDHLLKKRY